MKKIIHPCDVPVYNGKKYPMFCKIEYTNGRLSIAGVIGPTVHGNAIGGCGQIDMDFWHPTIRKDGYYKPSMLRFSEGWDNSTFLKFIRYWAQWHLNDMHAECIHQEKLGWTYETHHGEWIQKEVQNSVVDEYDTGETHIEMVYNPYLGHACPECGYRIGSAWTMRDVPEWVIQFLFSLPDTDRTPNWV